MNHARVCHELPEPLLFDILRRLPAADQAYAVRRCSKATHSEFRAAVVISAADPQLSPAALQECYQQQAAAADDQCKLIAARASCGDLSGVQWLRAQDPPCAWDAEACISAAAAGQLSVLSWLRAQSPPCPWGAALCHLAAEGGHLAVLQWARQQQPPCPWYGAHFLAKVAAAWGQWHVAQWLVPGLAAAVGRSSRRLRLRRL